MFSTEVGSTTNSSFFRFKARSCWFVGIHMGVSENSRFSPPTQIIHGLIGISIINHPFLGENPYFWKHPHRDSLHVWSVESLTLHNKPSTTTCLDARQVF